MPLFYIFKVVTVYLSEHVITLFDRLLPSVRLGNTLDAELSDTLVGSEVHDDAEVFQVSTLRQVLLDITELSLCDSHGDECLDIPLFCSEFREVLTLRHGILGIVILELGNDVVDSTFRAVESRIVESNGVFVAVSAILDAVFLLHTLKAPIFGKGIQQLGEVILVEDGTDDTNLPFAVSEDVDRLTQINTSLGRVFHDFLDQVLSLLTLGIAFHGLQQFLLCLLVVSHLALLEHLLHVEADNGGVGRNELGVLGRFRTRTQYEYCNQQQVHQINFPLFHNHHV